MGGSIDMEWKGCESIGCCTHYVTFSYVLYIQWFNVKALLSHPGLNLWYFGQQRKYRSGKMYWMTSPWPWPKVMAVALINKNLLVWKIKWQPLIQSLQVMLITWLDLGDILLETFFLANLF